MHFTTLYGTVTTHIGGPWVLHLVDDNRDGTATIREIEAFLAELNPEEVVAFWDQYPKIEDRKKITRVVVVNTDDFKKVETVYAFGAATNSFGEECLHRLHRLFFNKEYEGVE